jgi:hypothetical protein
MTTLRTLPCPCLRIRIPLVNHLDNQMAVQAHRRSAVDVLGQSTLSHASEPPCDFSFPKQFCFRRVDTENQ